MLHKRFEKVRCRMPMNIQFFAESAGGGTEQGSQNGGAQSQNQSGQAAGQQGQNQTGGQQTVQIDYAKIQQMLDGTLADKEDVALKSYFKQQGLTQQEAEQAMAAFKQQKAASHPDTAALQAQIAQSQAAAREATLEKEAVLVAVGLGLDAKSIPYVLKMADLSSATGSDGQINGEAIKSAINKVLEDVPALKPQPAGTAGFIQVGVGGGQNPSGAVDTELDRIFGVKKK